MSTPASPPASHHSLPLIAGVAFLVLGILIYLCWRSANTNLTLWLGAVGLQTPIQTLRDTFGSLDPGDFIRFNLPDGLFCLSYILIINHIWRGATLAVRLAMASLMPLIAAAHELLQGLGLMNGTFDPLDILVYLLPLAGFILVELLRRTTKGQSPLSNRTATS